MYTRGSAYSGFSMVNLIGSSICAIRLSHETLVLGRSSLFAQSDTWSLSH